MRNDFFQLFTKREGKVVLGCKWSNLWLLTAVLTATFFAIAFSNASMRYLSDKMNDPFIKWVDIKNDLDNGDFSGLEEALNDFENRERFDYNSIQADYYWSYFVFGKDGDDVHYLRFRFFEDIQTDLVREILKEENVVNGACISDLESLSSESVGIVITREALDKLGFEKAPAFINISMASQGADTLGFKLYEDQFGRVPVPVLAVVNRLPSSVDVIASEYLFTQDNNDQTYPFNLNNQSYAQSLHYFIPTTIDRDEFLSDLESTGKILSSVSVELDEYSFYKPELMSHIDGGYVSLIGNCNSPLVPLEAAAINDRICQKWENQGVFRVYDYNFSPSEVSYKSFLSVNFNGLDHIREFEYFVKENYYVKIDMSQINAKENFNAVSIMAEVLSWAMIVFAIICIIMFIMNLLRSYFQKVKRNIGTFKAFGVSNRILTSIYVKIVLATIVSSILIALSIVFMTQEILLWAGVLKDGIYGYLSLWSAKTGVAVIIVVAASVATVKVVMGRLLSNTPGDLIYDR